MTMRRGWRANLRSGWRLYEDLPMILKNAYLDSRDGRKFTTWPCLAEGGPT